MKIISEVNLNKNHRLSRKMANHHQNESTGLKRVLTDSFIHAKEPAVFTCSVVGLSSRGRRRNALETAVGLEPMPATKLEILLASRGYEGKRSSGGSGTGLKSMGKKLKSGVKALPGKVKGGVENFLGAVRKTDALDILGYSAAGMIASGAASAVIITILAQVTGGAGLFPLFLASMAAGAAAPGAAKIAVKTYDSLKNHLRA